MTEYRVDKNDAVSPVIAVILLIGLTVVLVGVVGVSVMGFMNTGTFSEYRVVGAVMHDIRLLRAARRHAV